MKMQGKTVLITGSTDGVGRYVASQLAAEGAHVLIHGRDAARADALIGEIKRAGHEAPKFYSADLSSLAGVRRARSRPRTDPRHPQDRRYERVGDALPGRHR